MQPNKSSNISISSKIGSKEQEDLVYQMVHAAKSGNIAELMKLLNKRLLDLRDKDGNTAIHIAVEKGQLKTVQWLLKQ